MRDEEQKAFSLLQTFGERASDAVDEVILSLQSIKSCKELVDVNLEYWLKVKEIVLNCSSSAEY